MFGDPQIEICGGEIRKIPQQMLFDNHSEHREIDLVIPLYYGFMIENFAFLF